MFKMIGFSGFQRVLAVWKPAQTLEKIEANLHKTSNREDAYNVLALGEKALQVRGKEVL